MGMLLGHLFPGLVIYSMGLYYAVVVSRALLRGQEQLFHPLPPRHNRDQRWWQQVHVEGVVKVGAFLILIVGEFFFPPGTNHFPMVDWKDPRQPFQNRNSWQHATIFGFFLLSGLVDLISQVWLAWQSIKLEQAGTVLALAVLLLQMVAHTEHKNALEIRTHSLPLLPVFLLVLVLTTEVWVPSQPLLWVFKTWLLLVFGSWMLQMTSTLYAPLSGQPWWADSPEDLAFLTIFFCWHLAIQAEVLAVVYALCSLWHGRCSSCIEVPSTRHQPYPTDPSSEELEKLRVEAVLQDGEV